MQSIHIFLFPFLFKGHTKTKLLSVERCEGFCLFSLSPKNNFKVRATWKIYFFLTHTWKTHNWKKRSRNWVDHIYQWLKVPFEIVAEATKWWPSKRRLLVQIWPVSHSFEGHRRRIYQTIRRDFFVICVNSCISNRPVTFFYSPLYIVQLYIKSAVTVLLMYVYLFLFLPLRFCLFCKIACAV